MKSILLAGATGLVGTAALELLLADGRVSRVIAPTRRPLPLHDKLLNPVATIAELSADADWLAVDGAVLAVGTTRAKTPSRAEYRAIDHDYPLTIATLARERGAESLALVSSAGANSRSRFTYTRTKGELEDAIDHLGYPSLTIARPGFLGGERSEHRAFEKTIGALLRVAGPALPAGARINPASAVAAMLVGAVLKGERGRRVIGSAEIARTAELGR